MTKYLFVGERPSPTALARGWTWRDGRLAAKQLFDAFEVIGIDPALHRFDNVFKTEADEVCHNALRRIRRAWGNGLVVVAMGKKAEAALSSRGVDCLSIPHPAARGRIRKKERYAAAVREVLTCSV